jgi:hypothetical protein
MNIGAMDRQYLLNVMSEEGAAIRMYKEATEGLEPDDEVVFIDDFIMDGID